MNEDLQDALIIAILEDPEHGEEIAQWAEDNPDELRALVSEGSDTITE